MHGGVFVRLGSRLYQADVTGAAGIAGPPSAVLLVHLAAAMPWPSGLTHNDHSDRPALADLNGRLTILWPIRVNGDYLAREKLDDA